MKIKTGNYITKIGKQTVIKRFQNVAYQILYGNYIDPEFKKENIIINYKELSDKYGRQINFLLEFDVLYYRIISTECNDIITFLNSALEIVGGVETIPEGKGF